MEHALSVIAGLRSFAQLDEMSRAISKDYGSGKLTDDDAAALYGAVEARRREVRGVDRLAVRAPHVVLQARAAGRPSHFPPRKRQPTSPDRRASMTRRRTLAASAPMPPAMAAGYTTGELATLRIVADQVRDTGDCRLTLGEIAARAGVGITTARNAIHGAALDGILTVQLRRRRLRPNLPNVVRIVSQEWLTWIKRGPRPVQRASTYPKGGYKNPVSTDIPFLKDTFCYADPPPKTRKAPLWSS
ncbi:MAG: hypothetical protein LBV49_10745 [Azonexus sp.]|jgi:hypothetical protein|nr:hypothetical protein [Azonexus sp.]